MVYHILNGDATVRKFLSAEITGEILIYRECLIEEDVNASHSTCGKNDLNIYQKPMMLRSDYFNNLVSV